MDNHDLVSIDYTNYRGERSIRTIRPDRIWFGENEYHKPAQWLLDANDIEKGAARTFALSDIHSWKPGQGVGNSSKSSDVA